MAYELIETIEVGTSQPVYVEFTSIPQDGSHLMVLFSGRNGSTDGDVKIRINGGFQNYLRRFHGTGTGVGGGGSNPLWRQNRSGMAANTFTPATILIGDYTSSEPHHVYVTSTAENDSSIVEWQAVSAIQTASASPVTSIGIGGSGYMAQYTSASLYKIS